jgi:glucose-6-phosphate 1-dehydrogenase
MSVELAAVHHAQGDEVEACERLLTDAMQGDSLLFMREDAVAVLWGVVQQLLGTLLRRICTNRGRGDPRKQTAWRLTSEAGITSNDG